MSKKWLQSALSLLIMLSIIGCSNVKDELDGGEPVVEETASFPMTINHALGSTVIERKPENVVTISWGNQDVPLALGIVPTGVSKANFGALDQNGLLPWTTAAYEALGATSPVVFDDTDGLDFEAISDANPDVILASYSGITQEEYDLLSQIAPVIAYPKHAWQTFWRDQTQMNATAMGLAAEGKALIAKTEELIASKVAAYQEMQGKSAVFIYFVPADLGTFYVYLPVDPRASYLMDLGLAFPDSVLSMADDKTAFTVTLSAENIDMLSDIDVVLTYGDDALLNVIQADALIGQMPAIANGAVVMLDPATALAGSCTPTVLSIPATIDEYLGLINDAAAKVK